MLRNDIAVAPVPDLACAGVVADGDVTPDRGAVRRPNRVPLGWWLTAAAGLVLLAQWLAVCNGTGLWRDEAVSLGIAGRSIGGIVRVAANGEANMGLYYLVLHLWQLVGDSPAWLRLLSLLCALAALPVLFRLGRRWLSDGWAGVACLLLATTYGVVGYAAETRAYTMGLLLAVTCMLAFVRLLERDSAARRVGYAVVSVALVYTLLLGVLVVLGQVVAVTLVRRRRAVALRPLLVAWAGAAVLCVPMGLFVLFRNRGQEAWVSPLAWHDVSDLFVFFSGPHLQWLVLLGGLVAASWALRRQRGPAGDGTWWILVCWAAFPVAALVAISAVSPMFVPRYLLFCAPAVALLAAKGLSEIHPVRRRPVAALLVVAFVALAGFNLHVTGRTDDISAAARWIDGYPGGGAAIGYDPSGARSWFDPLLGRAAAGRPAPADLALRPGHSPTAEGNLYGTEITGPELRHRLVGVSALWLVRYWWPWPVGTARPWRAEAGYVRTHFRLVDRRRFGEVEVDRFEARSP